MATYYWVGGSGTWNTVLTTNWASSTGGAGGAGVPTSADSVIFDSASGAAPTVIVTAAVCSACTVGAPTSGTLTFAFGVSTLTAAGNITFTTTVSVTGTGTITQSAANATFAGNGNTFYNLTFSSGGISSVTISGANTFNNLTFATRTSGGSGQISFAANQIINGTLTTAATSVTTRNFIVSSVLGTPRTLTAAAVSLTDTDFRDIVGAGTATWSGTRLGDAQGNSGITFATPKTVYWNLAGAQQWKATGWATSSGGTPAVNNFPLPQDTAVFDNTGSVTGTISMVDIYNNGTVDMSNRTSAMTLAVSATNYILGNWKNGTGTTLSGTSSLQFYGRTTQTITSNNIAFTQPITVFSFGGTVRLVDALTTASTNTFTLTNGTLDINGKTLTTGLFSSSTSGTRAIAFGTGNIALTGNAATIWTTSTVTGLTVSGTPVVNATYSGATGTRTITFGALSEANSISLNVSAGADIVALTATGGFKDLVFTGFAGTLTNTAMTIYGNLTLVSGMTLTAGASAATFAATSGTKTITTATKTLDFPITFNGLGGTFAFQDALTQGSSRAFTITNGTVQLKASATSTVGAFATSGTTQKYLQSTTAGTTATLSQASGTVNASYLTVQDITATGGATWNAFYTNGNVDNENNLGWNFGGTPAVDTEIGFRLRSFTQPRRF